MTSRRYCIIRGVLLADPVFTVASSGAELAHLRIGVRMPDGLVEPVMVEAGEVMPAYCRAHGLLQGDFILVSGWAVDTPAVTVMRDSFGIGAGSARYRGSIGADALDPIIQADMLAADTSLDWMAGRKAGS